MFDIMDDLSTPSPSLERDFCRRHQGTDDPPDDGGYVRLNVGLHSQLENELPGGK